MKLITTLLAAVLSLQAVAGYPSPVIFSGNYARTIPSQFSINDLVYIATGTADPTSVAVSAPKGSLYMRYGASGGTVYFKTDAGSSTNWSPIGSSANGSFSGNVNINGSIQPTTVDFVATGTTTVNASNAVVGVSTLFTTELAVGDRISLSSAAGTYRTVTTITDATHLTLSSTIGNNTAGTTINVKKAILKGNDSLGVQQFLVGDNGTLSIGPTVNWNGTGAAGGAQGWLNVTAPVASNTIVDLQFNSDARLILRRANATVTASATGVGNVISAPTKVLSTQTIGTLGFQGYQQATGSFVLNSGVIQAVATEDFTSTANGTKMTIDTTPNGAVASVTAVTIDQDQSVKLAGPFKFASVLLSPTAPTYTSGGCTSPSIAANNGPSAFTINVGSSCSGSQPLVIGLPTATTGWNCFVMKRATTSGASHVVQSATSATSVTLTNVTDGTTTAVAWVSSEVLGVSCFAY